MRILITGGSGLLGKSLLETMPDGHNLTMTYNDNWQASIKEAEWHKLDVRDRLDVFELFELTKPNLVIHCASIGSVDYTETNYQEVRDVNVGGLSHVIDACNGYKSKLVYISTNAVYSGNYPPYSEESARNPINSYGTVKVDAEKLVQLRAKKWLIFRPFMLYGWPYKGARTNWAVKIVEDLRESGKVLNLVDDITWMPTYAPDCASVMWKLSLETELDQETFNIASPERSTLYQFGLKVCEVFRLERNLLRPVQSNFFSVGQGMVKAKRPIDTSYDLLKLSRYGIMLSDIKTGLEKMREAQNEL